MRSSEVPLPLAIIAARAVPAVCINGNQRPSSTRNRSPGICIIHRHVEKRFDVIPMPVIMDIE